VKYSYYVPTEDTPSGREEVIARRLDQMGFLLDKLDQGEAIGANARQLGVVAGSLQRLIQLNDRTGKPVYSAEIVIQVFGDLNINLIEATPDREINTLDLALKVIRAGYEEIRLSKMSRYWHARRIESAAQRLPIIVQGIYAKEPDE
jgi:hypothetical protein